MENTEGQNWKQENLMSLELALERMKARLQRTAKRNQLQPGLNKSVIFI